MIPVLKPPTPLTEIKTPHTLFLAGSIEMGLADDWQTQLTVILSDIQGITILNPRRDEWDTSWVQSVHNPIFSEQVTWELAALEQASVIAMYFAPQTKAPISLLELGLFGRSGRMIVCCPDGYWRKGNVEVVCQRYAIPLLETLTDLATAVRKRLAEENKTL